MANDAKYLYSAAEDLARFYFFVPYELIGAVKDEGSTISAQKFKTRLGSHTVTTYYQKATPVITSGTPQSITAYYPTTVITTDKSTVTAKYSRDINPAPADTYRLLSGTFAARPLSAITRTMYIATDKAVATLTG